MTLSCSDVRVTAVDVARVEIDALSLPLMVGDSARMHARLLDASGNELRGRAISWSSGMPDVATVDAAGRVLALSPGSTSIAAASEGARDEVLIAIAARPALVVDPVSVTLTVRAGGPPPPAATVMVRANGQATGLSATTSYGQGQPAGWLIASLTGSTTPAMLTLNVSNTGMAAGTYDASVTIDATDAASERALPVTLVVQPREPAIGVSARSTWFDARHGGQDPPLQTIAITNEGGGSLDGLRLAIAYAEGEPTGWLNASLDRTVAPATLKLEPVTGSLALGAYSATVLVASDAAINSPQAIDVNFVVEPPPPVISLSTSTLMISGTAGGPDPPPAQVAISNGGGGQLDGLHATVTHAPGEPTGWLSVTVSPNSAPATLMLSASTSALAAGSYSAAVEIGAADASIAPATLMVTLNANAPVLTPAIGASVTGVLFSAMEGGANPAGAVVDITNSGGGTLDGLALAISYDAAQPTGWLNATLGAGTAPTSLTAQASTGTLRPGIYGATVEVSSPVATNSPLAIDVTFEVLGPPSIAVSANAFAFSDIVGGSNPPAQTVDVTNAGGGTLDGLSVNIKYGSGKGWLSATLSGQTAPASISLQPVTGTLSAGTYTAIVEIKSGAATNSPVLIDVAFTVGASPVIALDAASLAFQGSAGGSAPQSQSVGITNGGGGTLSGLAATVRYAAGQPGGWLSVVLDRTTAPATLTVQPDIGSLAVGTYGASIDVSSWVASNSPQTIDVTFTVATLQPPAAPVLVSVEERHHHADVTWQDNSANENSFIVQRSPLVPDLWVDVVSLPANTTSHHDTTGTAGLLYYYRIAACNAAGCSTSNVLSVVM